MKKIYTLLLMLGGVFTATQAQVHFVLDGKVIQSGETLEFYAEDLYGIGQPQAGTGELCVQNEGSSVADISVTVRKQEPADADLLWCLGGKCEPLKTRSKTISVSLEPNSSSKLMLDGNFIMGEYATYKTTVTLAYNDEFTTINVNFVYADPSGIASPVAEALKFANNTISYSFDTQATRVLNVYNTAGALVKSFTIGQNGTASLTGLTAGVYVATVTANGQKVATRKCLVR